jgi:calcineurin-like phosphoesterase
MVGPRDSVLGVDPAIIVARFRTGMPRRFEVASGPVQFNSVLIDVDAGSGNATGIRRIDHEWGGPT